MNKKLTKALAITILSSMVMVGCGTVEKSVDINSTTPVQEQQVTPNTKTYKKPVVHDNEGKQPTQKVNKPVENKTTHKAVETVKPNTTKQNTTKTQTQKTQTTKNKVNETQNNSNVIPDNTPGTLDVGGQGWSSDGNYYNGEPVTENEKEYIKQYGHQSKYDDGEWQYNPYTGETRE
nr:MAG TPA: protein of unknown function (DUF5016) [Caudoviricetes sp.]